MFRVENCFQELLVTMNAANVLRWRAAFTTRIDRMANHEYDEAELLGEMLHPGVKSKLLS